MSDLSFKKESSALLIIDMQNAFIHKEGSLSKMGLDTSRTLNVIEPIKRLKEEFKAANRPIIYIQHNHRKDKLDAGLIAKVFPPIMDLGHCIEDTWDAEIIDELKPESNDYIVKKHRFSAFFNTQLESVLNGLNVDNLVIAGISTNICVESTVRDAFYRDYNVVVPRETTAAFTEQEEISAIGNFHFAFARVVELDEMIEKLK